MYREPIDASIMTIIVKQINTKPQKLLDLTPETHA